MVGAFRAEPAEWPGNYKSYLRELTKEVAGIFDNQSLMRSVNLYASRATSLTCSGNVGPGLACKTGLWVRAQCPRRDLLTNRQNLATLREADREAVGGWL
jgi:hypothetical protein